MRSSISRAQAGFLAGLRCERRVQKPGIHGRTGRRKHRSFYGSGFVQELIGAASEMKLEKDAVQTSLLL